MTDQPRLAVLLFHDVLEGHYLKAWAGLRGWLLQTITDAPLHFAVEASLILFLLFLLLWRRSPKKATPGHGLSEEVVEELCQEWQPEPLTPTYALAPESKFAPPPLVEGTAGPTVMVGGMELINLGTFSFLGLTASPEIKAVAKQTILRYGVGSCGPRGFYGTFDVHQQLEADLAAFYGTEQAIVFSSVFATISSVIPAFSKRGDIIIADKGVSLAAQTGVQLSRSTTFWFKHNDAKDLARILAEVEKRQVEAGENLERPTARKFVVIEGLYTNYGDVPPMHEILKLKERYCFRIIMDDSQGVGALGATGRGTLEHWGLPSSAVEILTSSLSGALASTGGYCVGSREVVFHQTLNAAGYVFSASSPPYLAAVASKALSMVTPELMVELRANVKVVRQQLREKLDDVFDVSGIPHSPIIHLRLRQLRAPDHDNAMLDCVVEEARKRGVALARARYVVGERYAPPPSLRVTVSAAHTPQQLKKAIEVLEESVRLVMERETMQVVEDELTPNK